MTARYARYSEGGSCPATKVISQAMKAISVLAPQMATPATSAAGKTRM